MKRIIFLSACALWMNIVMAQDTTIVQDTAIKKKIGPPAPSEGMYCAAFRDGRMVVMIGEKMLTKDIELQNGSKITTTGKVVKKNGGVQILKNGQCVNKEGNITDKASLK